MTEAADWHTLFMIADNEPGVLARVTGLFSARGYQIQSLTAGEINEAQHLSCMTITTYGTPQVIAQIKAQLEKIIAIRSVHNLSVAPGAFTRELALVRIQRDTPAFAALEEKLDLFGADRIDASEKTVTYELTGEPAAIDLYLKQLYAIGPVDISRSGITGIADRRLDNP